MAEHKSGMFEIRPFVKGAMKKSGQSLSLSVGQRVILLPL